LLFGAIDILIINMAVRYWLINFYNAFIDPESCSE